MTPEQFGRVKEIFGLALGCAPADRGRLLDRECGGDHVVRREVESLLSESENTGSFLESISLPAELADLLADPPSADGSASAGRDPATTPRTQTRVCMRCRSQFDDNQKFCPYDGEVLTEDPSALVGETLDGVYLIEALLGQGGMGTVYRARHVLLRDVVAVKVLPREMNDNPTWLRRFLREGQAARRFRHPNAVAVHDLRTSQDGTPFMVLEYVEGRTLRSELKQRGALRPGKTLSILEPIADVLDAAHAKGVIHRDLKPDNVMLGTDDRGDQIVKVLDLGIAKLNEVTGFLAESTELTQEGAFIGTPRYMSPEQWGQPSRDGGTAIDGRADVYSLGIMTYEMVSGLRPIPGNTVPEMRAGHLGFHPPEVHEVGVEVTPEFGHAIARAMAKDRADRPKRASDFVSELRDALAATEPIVVDEDVTTVERATSPEPTRSRSPLSVRVGGVCVLIMLVGAAAYFGLAGFRRTATPLTTSTAHDATPPKIVDVLSYSIELNPDAAAGASPSLDLVPSGGEFKFHFTSRQSAYLYIVARGPGDVPMTFLTDVPMAESGVTTNKLDVGQDYQFPRGSEHWLGVTDVGTPTVYTVVLSSAPMRDPEVLGARAGKPLSPSDLESLRILKAESVETGKVNISHDAIRSDTAIVAAEPGMLATRPLVFDISIRHK